MRLATITRGGGLKGSILGGFNSDSVGLRLLSESFDLGLWLKQKFARDNI